MKKDILIVLLIIVIFSLSFVNATELILPDVKGYILEYSGDRLVQDNYVKILRYTNSDNISFNVIFWFSDDSKDIDNLFYDKISNSQKNLDFGEYSIYVFGEGNYVFWRNNNYLIQIHSNSDKLNEFPTKLIEEYLRLNPPSCEGKGCYESILLEQEISSFEVNEELQNKINEYENIYIKCPSNPTPQSIKAKLIEKDINTQRFTSTDIDQMVDDCDMAPDDLFLVPKRIPDADILSQTEEVNNELRSNNFTLFNFIDAVREFFIRKFFFDKYDTNKQEETELNKIFQKRTKKLISDLKSKYGIISIEGENNEIIETTSEITGSDDAILDNNPGPESFDYSKNYTLETFPTYPSESSTDFYIRFKKYFGREFNITEWQEMQEGVRQEALNR